LDAGLRTASANISRSFRFKSLSSDAAQNPVMTYASFAFAFGSLH